MIAVLVATSDVDALVPAAPVRDTAAAMGAAVDLRVYPGMSHQVCADAVDPCPALIRSVRDR